MIVVLLGLASNGNLLVHAAVILVPQDLPTIGAALEAAATGDEIVVADGLYTGEANKNLDFHGKKLHLKSAHGAVNCIIDCQGSGRGFYFAGGETNEAVVEGFTVRNGFVAGVGGAVKCLRSSPTIIRCRFEHNSAFYHGGAVDCYRSSARLSYCDFIGNTAGTWGGAFSSQWEPAPIVSQCTFTQNDARIHGGALFTEGAPLIMTSCVFMNNTSNWGGALYLLNSQQLTLNDLLFDANHAATGGGAIYCDGSNSSFSQCTFTRNQAEQQGGAVVFYRVTLQVSNCIFWGDRAPAGMELALRTGPPPTAITLAYTELQGGPAGIFLDPDCIAHEGDGVIDQNPIFVKGTHGARYLSSRQAGQPADSPCVDSGSDRAESICFAAADGSLCMDHATTSTDGVPDAETVDLGYHYRR